MARLLAALLAVLLLVGQSSDAAPSEAEAFWRAVLPDSPLPDSILQLLHPDTNSVNEAQDTDAQGRRTVRHLSSPFFYRYSFHKHSSLSPSGAGSSNSVHEAQDTDAQGRRTVRRLSNPFLYRYGSHKHSSPGQSGADDTTADDAVVRAFFHEEALHVGANMTFYFPPAARAPLGLLPRSAADSIPFSTSSLPAVLSLLGIAGDSAEAAGMRETLEMCESEPVAGEAQFCAASLEALVEGAMAALGTRGIRPVTSALPSSGAPLQPYAIRALRRVDGSSFVSCHDMEYPYTVYMCHATGWTRAYVVDLEGAGGAGEKATVVTVCHTDTAMWDPDHVSFRILGTKPGAAPVCHFLPYGHIMWAKNTIRSSAA